LQQQGKELERKEMGPSRRGWAFLLLALSVAALLRFWQLGDAPPGLYRDEAFNGLDALQVLQGEHALFFTANNGREPAYIYLTAVAVALFGRTALAVRLGAAAIGTLTTWLTYRLARSWFGVTAGLFAAWLWAVTLWPVHLSRIGLRPILLPPLLALTFWLGTRAYRRQQRRWWVGAGIAYGLTFYTYLAARFTPILLLFLFSYLFLSGSQRRKRLWPGVLWFLVSVGVTMLPVLVLLWQDPSLLLGRAGQVSILNETVNGGDLWGTLLRHIGRGLGLFLWRGDTIVRHNPPGRPVFDLFMALPFLVGLLWSLRHWRRPPALALLLWQAIMLGPTILAEDAPHFLRAVGLLPAAVMLPALGLSKVWEWPKLAGALRRGLVVFLALGTLIMTIANYATYVNRPETFYLFEGAARALAEEVNQEPPDTHTYVDRRYWEGWPSIPFLVDPERAVTYFTPEAGVADRAALPLALYAWPHGSLAFLPEAVPVPSLLSVQPGPLARGDLESDPYLLFVRYLATQPPRVEQPIARFGKTGSEQAIWLLDGIVTQPAPDRLQIDLYWQTGGPPGTPLAAFVHLLDEQGLVGQSDGPLAQGYWPAAEWRPEVIIHERRYIDLDSAFEPSHQNIFVGIYDAQTRTRLPVYNASGDMVGDTWPLQATPAAQRKR
jgi:4-amino-4-deoxy-L-arabinose transferase-like glycosyltransferase